MLSKQYILQLSLLLKLGAATLDFEVRANEVLPTF